MAAAKCTCPDCGLPVDIPADAFNSITCPVCDACIPLPERRLDEGIKFRCLQCSKILKGTRSHVGKSIACPNPDCRAKLTILGEVESNGLQKVALASTAGTAATTRPDAGKNPPRPPAAEAPSPRTQPAKAVTLPVPRVDVPPTLAVPEQGVQPVANMSAAGVTTAPLAQPEPAKRENGLLRLTGLSAEYRVSLTAWEQAARPHYGSIVGPTVGYVFLFALIYTVVLLLSFIFIGILLEPLLMVPLAAGFHIVCLAQLKDQQWSFGTFFSGFRWWWPLVARGLLLWLIPAVCLLLLLLVTSALMLLGKIISGRPRPPDALAWVIGPLGLSGIVATVYISLRSMFFSLPLILDRGCGPIDAIKGSWILSRGHFWGLTGTGLLLIVLVYLIGLLTLGIGMLFALPRVLLVWNAGYLLCTRRNVPPQSGGTEPPLDQTRPPRWRRWPILATSAASAVLLSVVAIGLHAGLTGSGGQGFASRGSVKVQEQKLRAALTRCGAYGGSITSDNLAALQAALEAIDMNRADLGQSFPSAARAVARKDPKAWFYILVLTNPGFSLESLRELLGNEDATEPGLVQISGQFSPQELPVTWHMYGWCGFGIDVGGRVVAIRANCSALPAAEGEDG